MSFPVLKGQIVYEDHGSGIWGKIASLLSGSSHAIVSVLPYIARAVSIYASSARSLSNALDYNNASWESATQLNRRSLAMPIPEPIVHHSIPAYKSEPIARNALDQLKQKQEYRQLSTPNWSELQARNQQILNELAAAKGLPSYQKFHQDNGAVYDFQPNPNQLGVDRFLQSSRQSNGFIQEDDWQIAQNLSHCKCQRKNTEL